MDSSLANPWKKMNSAKDETVLSDKRTKGNGLKCHQGRVGLDMRKNVLHGTAVMESPSLEMSKKYLGVNLRIWFSADVG